MKLIKILTGISFIVFLALVYVHQQTQIFYLAYQSDKGQSRFERALDRNNILRYNIGVYSSLHNLEKNLLAKYTDFEIPQEQRLVRLNLTGEGRALRGVSGRTNLFARFLNTLVRQAEAKPIKP